MFKLKTISLLYILILYTLSSLGSLTQNDSSRYFYYYNGEKRYLELNKGFIFISALGNDTSFYSEYQISKKLQKEVLSIKLRQKLNTNADFYWGEINLGKNISDSTYSLKIKELTKKDNIQIIAPYFKSKDSERIGLSNFFHVKLKTLADTLILRKISDHEKTVIVKQNSFMPLWFTLSVTKQSDRNALELANLYFESNLFECSEPDLMLDNLLTVNDDPYLPQQWGLHNTGQYGGNGIDIRAFDAWNMATGTNVNVAVIDNGIELTHPDLSPNLSPLSYDTENATSPSVVRGDHATACAGIIGAVGNTVGIKGVAPNCRLISISGTLNLMTPNIREKLADGFNWAVSNGAQIISNSWGHNDLTSALIDNAITNALNNGRSGLGCIVVFAAGNDNSSVCYPANSNSKILAVGAMSPCEQRKSPNSCDTETRWGSNYGATLDIVAPGVLISTTDRAGNNGYNPNIPIHVLNNGTLVQTDYAELGYTTWFNGTSAACPHVSGIAALILSINPNLTGTMVNDIIERTAQKVGGYSYATTSGRTNGTWHQEMGYGLIDACGAITQALLTVLTISGPTLVCSSGASFTLNNLPTGCTVNWTESINIIYVSGQGTNNYTVKAHPYASGAGWVQATITGNCGVVSRKDINWVGKPYVNPATIQFTCIEGSGYLCTNAYGNGFSFYNTGPYNYFDVKLTNLSETQTLDEFIIYTTEGTIDYYPPEGTYKFMVRENNDCGTGNWSKTTVDYVDCGGFGMLSLEIFPNPTTGETTVSIVSSNEEEVAVDDAEEWDLEVYTQSQLLKSIRTKIKGKECKLNTSGWNEGIYIIRVNYKNDVLTGKLIVKK